MQRQHEVKERRIPPAAVLVFGFLDIYFSVANENVLTLCFPQPPALLLYSSAESGEREQGTISSRTATAPSHKPITPFAAHRVSSTRQMWLSNLFSCLLAFVYFFLEPLGSFSKLKSHVFVFFVTVDPEVLAFFMARRDGMVLILKNAV